MHELSITRNIVSIVADKAAGRPVRKVHLQIGLLSGIEIPAIQFCFPMCAEGTSLQDAELVIHEVAGKGRCQGCDKDVDLQHLIAVCPCERREPLTITAGEELLVKAMEV